MYNTTDSVTKFENTNSISSRLQDFIPLLYGIAMKILKSEAHATQLVQQVLIKLKPEILLSSSDIESLKEKSTQMIRFAALEITKGHDYQQTKSVQNFDFMTYYENNKASVIPSDRKALNQLCEQLDEKSILVLDLAFFHGANREEIERILNIPTGSVKARLRRAVRELRTALEHS